MEDEKEHCPTTGGPFHDQAISLWKYLLVHLEILVNQWQRIEDRERKDREFDELQIIY